MFLLYCTTTHFSINHARKDWGKKLPRNLTFWVSSSNSFSSLLNSWPIHPFLHLPCVTIALPNRLISLGRCILFWALTFKNFVPTCSGYIYHSSSAAWPSFCFQLYSFLYLRFMHSSCFNQADLLLDFLPFSLQWGRIYLWKNIVIVCIICKAHYKLLAAFFFTWVLAYPFCEFMEACLLSLSSYSSFLSWKIMNLFSNGHSYVDLSASNSHTFLTIVNK